MVTFCVSLQRTLYTHIYIYDVRAVQTSSSKPQSTLVPPCLHPFNQSSCYFLNTAVPPRRLLSSLLAHLSKYPNVIAETATLKVAEMAAWVKGRIDGGMYLNANVL